MVDVNDDAKGSGYRRVEVLTGLRWSPDFGQVDKLGSPSWKDGPDGGQAEALFG